MAVDKKTQQVNEMGPEFMRSLADNAKHNLIRDSSKNISNPLQQAANTLQSLNYMMQTMKMKLIHER